MPSPFREAFAQEVVEATTLDGLARLTCAPDHARLELEDRVFTITRKFFSVAHKARRKVKKRSLEVSDCPVYVARAWPTNEVALWIERKPGVVWRALGLRPMAALDEDALAAWHKLDRLGTALARFMAEQAGGARAASEFGRGHHRVLAVQHPGKMTVYARPLFREWPRKMLELRQDGTVEFRRDRVHETVVDSGYGVILSGDRIRFCDRHGNDLGRLFVPWISVADRGELANRLRAQLPERRVLERGTAPLNPADGMLIPG